jgi:hypothetical protein
MRRSARLSKMLLVGLLFLPWVIGCQGPKIHGVVKLQDGEPADGATVVIAAVHGKSLSVPSGGLKAAVAHNGGYYSLEPGRERTSIYRITVTANNFEPASRMIDTRVSTEADIVLLPSAVYERKYQVGEEVQVKDFEWCPARVISASSNSYKIKYLNGGGTFEVPPEHIRPRDAGPYEKEFSCPWLSKK